MTERPRLTIGLSIADAQAVPEDAVAAVMNQTFTDFELVVVAEGSSAEACSRLMARDRRVRLVLGSAEGWGPAPERPVRGRRGRADPARDNAAFDRCRTDLFLWATPEPVPDPTLIERCVAALDADPTAALALSPSRSPIAGGSLVDSHPGVGAGWGSQDPVERFRAALDRSAGPAGSPAYAVVRTGLLARTGLLSSTPDRDRALLVELALHGRFLEVPAPSGHRPVPARADADLGSLTGRHLASIRRRPPGVPLRPLLVELARWTARHRRLLMVGRGPVDVMAGRGPVDLDPTGHGRPARRSG